MSDDLDDLIRRAMKSLDQQVPLGYFEDLPKRTLGRLEDEMATTREGFDQVPPVVAPVVTPADAPPQQPEPSEPSEHTAHPAHDEDSGLHDIRNLASSQRSRLKRSQDVSASDDDVIASSSAGLKAVALPEPAKLVTLPELSELPPKSRSRDSKRHVEIGPAHPATPQAAEGTAPTPIAPRQAKSKSTSGGGKVVLTAVGLGLAAAAGVGIFITVNNNNQDASAPARAQAHAGANAKSEPQVGQEAAPPTPTVTAIPSIATDTAATGSAAAAAPAPPPPAPPAAEQAAVAGKPEGKDQRDRERARPEKSKASKDVEQKPVATVEPKGGATAPPPGGAPAGGSSAKAPAKDKKDEGGLDELLKEAGVQNKVDKPKLEKKSLEIADIRAAMSAVEAKAQACYAGQQGMANVKLSVAPSGKVQKVTVTGVFAGTPVGACVESVVRGASFPPWEGGAQTVSYSYLLSE